MMDDEVVNRFSSFKLGEKEEGGVVLDGGEFRSRLADCERSLIGKIWGSRSVNFSGLKNTLSHLWYQKGELKVVELGHNFYQFILDLQEEKKIEF